MSQEPKVSSSPAPAASAKPWTPAIPINTRGLHHTLKSITDSLLSTPSPPSITPISPRLTLCVGKPMPIMCVLTIKTDEFHNPVRAKNRIVVLGNLESRMWTTAECYDPVLRQDSLRLLNLLPSKISAYSNKVTAKTPSANHTFLSMKSSSLPPLQVVSSPSLAPCDISTRLSTVYDEAPVTGTKSFALHSLLWDLHNASTIRVYSTALPSQGVYGSTWACMLTISYISQCALNPSSGSKRPSNPTSKSTLWDA
jgi:hypothetical protein